jgi:hypothetical protein
MMKSITFIKAIRLFFLLCWVQFLSHFAYADVVIGSNTTDVPRSVNSFVITKGTPEVSPGIADVNETVTTKFHVKVSWAAGQGRVIQKQDYKLANVDDGTIIAVRVVGMSGHTISIAPGGVSATVSKIGNITLEEFDVFVDSIYDTQGSKPVSIGGILTFSDADQLIGTAWASGTVGANIQPRWLDPTTTKVSLEEFEKAMAAMGASGSVAAMSRGVIFSRIASSGPVGVLIAVDTYLVYDNVMYVYRGSRSGHPTGAGTAMGEFVAKIVIKDGQTETKPFTKAQLVNFSPVTILTPEHFLQIAIDSVGKQGTNAVCQELSRLKLNAQLRGRISVENAVATASNLFGCGAGLVPYPLLWDRMDQFQRRNFQHEWSNHGVKDFGFGTWQGNNIRAERARNVFNTRVAPIRANAQYVHIRKMRYGKKGAGLAGQMVDGREFIYTDQFGIKWYYWELLDGLFVSAGKK